MYEFIMQIAKDFAAVNEQNEKDHLKALNKKKKKNEIKNTDHSTQ